MNNLNYFSQWYHFRPAFKLHWAIIATAVLAASVASVVALWKGLFLVPILMVLACFHGLQVAYLVKTHFFERKYPMLPGRKKSGLFISIVEAAYTLVSLSVLLNIVGLIHPKVGTHDWGSIANLGASWLFGWVMMLVFSRFKGWVFIFLMASIYLPNFEGWMIWKILTVFSLIAVLMGTLRDLFKSPNASGQFGKFASKKIAKPTVGFLNPHRIWVDNMTHPSLGVALRIGLLELAFCGLLLGAGMLVYSVIEFLQEGSFVVGGAKRAGFMFVLAFTRLAIKSTSSFSLVNGMPMLPGVSRQQWVSRNNRYLVLDRLATYAFLVLIPLVYEVVLNAWSGAQAVVSVEFGYYAFIMLLCFPAISGFMTLLSTHRNRTLFASRANGALFGSCGFNSEDSSNKPLVYLSIVMAFLLIAGSSAMALFRNKEIDLSNLPVALGILALCLLLTSTFTALENHFNKRAILHGDLV